MDRKRKAKKGHKMSKSKKTSLNPQLVCDKEAVVKVERLDDSFVEQMTNGRSSKQNDVERENVDEHITMLEQELANIAAELNLNNAVKEEELRAIEPELEKLKTQVKHEKYELLLEKFELLRQKLQLEKRLQEKEQLLIEAENFEKRLIAAEEKLVDFSNEVNKVDDGTIHINSLLEEIMIKIFSYLNHNELGEIASVCKTWNSLTKSPVLWKTVCVKFSPLHECPTTVARCLIDKLPSCVTRMNLNFTGLHEWSDYLKFEELCVSLHKNCPNLKVLTFEWATLSDGLSVIDLTARLLQNVKVLSFIDTSFYDDWPDCNVISKLEVLDFSSSNIRGCLDSKFPRMPYLKELCFCETDVEDIWFDNNYSLLNQLQTLHLGYTSINSWALQIIKNNGHNLENLYLCCTNIDDEDFNFNNEAFPNLKIICLSQCERVTCEGVANLIQSCHSLQNVYIDEQDAADCIVHPFFIANRCKLNIVKVIDSCYNHGNKDYLWK